MRKFSRGTGILTIVPLLAACAPLPSPVTETAVAPSPQLTVERTIYPLDTQTGVEEIDGILNVVATGDIQSLRSLLKFTAAECTTREGLGDPPKCQAGEAEGKVVDVFPFLGSEGSCIRKDELEGWLGIDISGLYAVYQVSDTVVSELGYPAGMYSILYKSSGEKTMVSVRVEDGMIVRIDTIFDISPESLDTIFQRESAKFILAPVS